MNKKQLIEFEKRVQKVYEAGEIKDYKNSKYNNYNSLINSKEMQEKVFFKEL